MPNDYLLAPGQTPNQQTVSKLQTITAPMGNTPAKRTLYYHNSMTCASIHRPDGKRISFAPYGIFEAISQEDITFLENEIEIGHDFIRRASDAEVQQYRSLRNPKAVLREEVENDIKKDLVKEIQEQILGGNVVPGSVAASVLDQLRLQGVDVPKLRGVASSETLAAVSASSIKK